MSREFDDALNDCLERIAEGEDVQKCVSRYPRHERELVPLVRVAMATMRLAAAPSYGPEGKARGLSRLNQALAHGQAPMRRSMPIAWRALTRPVAIGLVALLLTGLAAGGTTVASSNSVPGEPLYWVKTLKENISLKLRRSDIGRASVHARLASERGEEMRKLIARGRVHEADRLMGRITHHLNKSASYAGVSLSFNPTEMPARPTRLPTTTNALKLRVMLERDDRAMRSEMSELLRNAPPGVQNRVQQLIYRSELRYRGSSSIACALTRLPGKGPSGGSSPQGPQSDEAAPPPCFEHTRTLLTGSVENLLKGRGQTPTCRGWRSFLGRMGVPHR